MKLKNLNPNEKMLLGIILILLIAIVLSWGRISKGIKEGANPYFKTGNDSVTYESRL